MLAGEPADAAAEGEPDDRDVGVAAAQGHQPGVVEGRTAAPVDAGADGGGPPHRVERGCPAGRGCGAAGCRRGWRAAAWPPGCTATGTPCAAPHRTAATTSSTSATSSTATGRWSTLTTQGVRAGRSRVGGRGQPAGDEGGERTQGVVGGEWVGWTVVDMGCSLARVSRPIRPCPDYAATPCEALAETLPRTCRQAEASRSRARRSQRTARSPSLTATARSRSRRPSSRLPPRASSPDPTNSAALPNDCTLP